MLAEVGISNTDAKMELSHAAWWTTQNNSYRFMKNTLPKLQPRSVIATDRPMMFTVIANWPFLTALRKDLDNPASPLLQRKNGSLRNRDPQELQEAGAGGGLLLKSINLCFNALLQAPTTNMVERHSLAGTWKTSNSIPSIR